MQITMPYLDREPKGTRADRSGYLSPMKERIIYSDKAKESFDIRIKELLDWMDVEKSTRWLPQTLSSGKRATYCDHYAADFICQLFGSKVVGFGAWVWWTDSSLEDIKEEKNVEVDYGSTVRELGAKGLHSWMKTYGSDFHWKVFKTSEELRAYVNSTPMAIGTIHTPTHVAVVVPDRISVIPLGTSPVPLQSQAGSRNKKLWRQNDWYRSNKEVVFAAYSPLHLVTP
jgi:hypothetical protein